MIFSTRSNTHFYFRIECHCYLLHSFCAKLADSRSIWLLLVLLTKDGKVSASKMCASTSTGE